MRCWNSLYVCQVQRSFGDKTLTDWAMSPKNSAVFNPLRHLARDDRNNTTGCLLSKLLSLSFTVKSQSCCPCETQKRLRHLQLLPVVETYIHRVRGSDTHISVSSRFLSAPKTVAWDRDLGNLRGVVRPIRWRHRTHKGLTPTGGGPVVIYEIIKSSRWDLYNLRRCEREVLITTLVLRNAYAIKTFRYELRKVIIGLTHWIMWTLKDYVNSCLRELMAQSVKASALTPYRVVRQKFKL